MLKCVKGLRNSTKYKFILTSLAIISFMTACSQQIIDKEPHGEMQQEVITISDSSGTETSNRYYKIGEVFQKKAPVYKQPDKIASEYCITKAQIFENPQATNITKEQVIGGIDVYIGLSSEEPKLINKDIIISSEFLLCSMTIKNIDENSNDVSQMTLAYEKDDGTLARIGTPVYFSHHMKELKHYYEYLLPKGQTLEATIGWCIDEEVLEVTALNKEKFYLVIGFENNEKYREIVKLDVN